MSPVIEGDDLATIAVMNAGECSGSARPEIYSRPAIFVAGFMGSPDEPGAGAGGGRARRLGSMPPAARSGWRCRMARPPAMPGAM
jgi:hypothetical protein